MSAYHFKSAEPRAHTVISSRRTPSLTVSSPIKLSLARVRAKLTVYYLFDTTSSSKIIRLGF